MNRKGFASQILLIVLVGLVLAVVIGVYFMFSLVGPIIQDLGTDFTGEIRSITANAPTPASTGNLSDNAETALQIVDYSLAPLEWIGYLTLAGMLVGFMIALAVVRGHPAMIFVWIAVIVGISVMSIYVSNSYEQLATQPGIADAFSTWSTNHFIMTHLPHIMISFGIISSIIMLMLISTDREQEVIEL